jgi:hypothetical protein
MRTVRNAAALAVMLPTLAMAQTTTPSPMTPSTNPPAVTAPAAGANMRGAPILDSQARRASTVIGADIINEENNTVGEVHDLMISPSGGPIVAVLSVGGFLGIGERYVAVGLSDLRWNAERERWVLPGATVESLKARTAFTYPGRG